MTVETLDAVLRRLADLMEAAGAKGGPGAVRDLADGLAPFAALSLPEFATFLSRAEAYSRGDLEAVFPKTKGKKGTTAKAIADPNRVANAIASLRTLYERALAPGFSEEAVTALIVGLEKLTLPDLGQITAGCGFEQKFRTKKLALEALRKWILGRRGTFERAGA